MGSIHETSPLDDAEPTLEINKNGGVTTKRKTTVVRKESLASDTVTPWGVTLKPVARVSKVSVTEKEFDDSKIKFKGQDMPEFGVELGEIGFGKPQRKTSKVQVVIDKPDTPESVEKKAKATAAPKKPKSRSVTEAPKINISQAKVRQKTRRDSKAYLSCSIVDVKQGCCLQRLKFSVLELKSLFDNVYPIES